MKAMTLRLPEATWERLREQAHQEHTTITALVLGAIEYTHAWSDETEGRVDRMLQEDQT